MDDFFNISKFQIISLGSHNVNCHTDLIFSHKHQQDKPLLLRFPSHISRNLLGHVISGKVSKIQNDVGKMFEKWWVLKPSISCNVLQEVLTECHVVPPAAGSPATLLPGSPGAHLLLSCSGVYILPSKSNVANFYEAILIINYNFKYMGITLKKITPRLKRYGRIFILSAPGRLRAGLSQVCQLGGGREEET